jgi:dihydroorotate dehydrogenase (fumarate)
MAELYTTYLGLSLKNPVIVSSSGLTDSVDKIRALESYGAGAVVLKSLFEEQIKFEAGRMIEHSDYPETNDIILSYARSNQVDNYLQLITDAKKQVKIPVIASINCISASEWVESAIRIEEAGADALELNVFFFPSNKDLRSDDFEQIYYDLALKIKSRVKIPIAFKLGQNFTSLVNVVDRLYYRGVNGVVLFNRFYEPDINLRDITFKSGEVFSSPAEISKPLRWIGIISEQVKQIDIAGSTGVHDGNGVAKLILAGAKAVMVCSALYKHGPEYLKQIIIELEDWMNTNSFESVNDFRGKMNYGKLSDPTIYERSQFMKYFSNYH